MTRRFLKLLFLLGALTLSNGQSTTTGSWEAYFSYNSIKDIEIGSDIIYAASENAIFTYDPYTNSIETITTIEGLSGDYITTIKYSENYNLLMIGYETGLMEVYDLNTNTVLKVVDILNQITIPPNNRRINDFYEFDNLVYISTNYGISIYDMQSLEFGDTYYIGFNGTQTRVHQITLNNNEIYAATSDGLKKANLNNPNLIDFQFWQTPFLGDFLSVISIADQVFTIKSDNILYAVNDNSLSPVLSFTEPILRLEPNENNFSIITANKVYYYQEDLSLLSSYNNSPDLNTTFTTSKIFNDIIYIGTLGSGMLKTSNNSNDLYEKIIPNGPLRNNPFSLHFGYGDLWVTFGDYDEDFNPNPNREYGFSFLENNIWTNVSYDSIQQNIEKPCV